jgi:hypothetical protein
MALRKITAWLGVVSLLVCCYFCLQLIRQIQLNPQPLVLPVSLKPGNVTTPPFPIDIDQWEYQVDLQFDPRFERVPTIQRFLADGKAVFAKTRRSPLLEGTMCLLGAEPNADTCDGIGSVIDISWKVREGSDVVAGGSSHAFGYGYEQAGNQVVRTLGTFRGRRGHSYTLLMEINRDASELDVTNPRLVVHVPYSSWNDMAMANGFLEICAVVSGLFGLALLLPTIRKWVVQRVMRR